MVITILLIRGLTLDGAVDGIIFYLKPDFTKLSDINVSNLTNLHLGCPEQSSCGMIIVVVLPYG